jgi:hypothetical protein
MLGFASARIVEAALGALLTAAGAYHSAAFMLGFASARIVEAALGALLTAAGAYHSATFMLGFASGRIVRELSLPSAITTAVISASETSMASATLKPLPPNLWLFQSGLVIIFCSMVLLLVIFLIPVPGH